MKKTENKYYIVSIVLLCIVFQLHLKAQEPTWEWVKTARGSALGMAVTAGPSTNVYCAGNFADSLCVPTTTLLNQYSPGSFFLNKYTPNGNLIWAKKLSPYGNIGVTSIATDASENIFILGTYRSLAYIDTFTLGSYPNNGTDIVYLAKLDSSGKTLWVRTCGGDYYCNPNYVTVDGSGNPIICGTFMGDSIKFNQIKLTNSDIPNNSPGIFLAKYDANGNALWAHHYGGNNNSNANVPTGLACDAADNIYMSGWFTSATLLFPTVTLNNSSGSNQEIFISKITSSGNFVWAKKSGGIDGDEAMAIGVDGAGYIYLAGDFRSNTISFGTTVLTNTNATQWWGVTLFLTKYDGNGNAIWARSKNLCSVQSMGIDQQGNTYISGFLRDSVTFGQNKLKGNFYLGIYDNSGNDEFGKDIKIKKAIGGNNFVRCMYVSPKVNGAVYVTGGFDCKKIYPDTCTALNFDTTGAKSAFFLVKTNTAYVGITELIKENEFALFPNPCSSYLNLEIKNNSSENLIIITDISGRKIKQELIPGLKPIKIHVSDLADGVYILEIKSGAFISRKKFVKN